MKRYVLANWKAHKTLPEAAAWLDKFGSLYQSHPQVEVIIAPAALYLLALHQKLAEGQSGPLALAMQDLSAFPLGSYTGELAAEMVRGLVDYVLLGHSERRRYFHETDLEVAKKVREARAANIRPIVCVDRPYARSQLAALTDADLDEVLIGYGPVEAIGINLPQAPSLIQAALAEIRNIAPGRPILYGGSINRDNAGACLAIPGVAGLMVGTASLDPEEFAGICQLAAAGF